MRNSCMMRYCLSFFCCLIIVNSSYAQTDPPAAKEVLQKVYTKAAREHKNVFLLFHASWCGWCHRMDSLMASRELKKFFTDNYIITHLTVEESAKHKDLENPGGMDVLKKYHGEKQGLPFWVILDAKGNLLSDSEKRPAGAGPDTPGENTGCPATKEEVAFFKKVLQKTSHLTDSQLAVIEKNFYLKN